MTTDRLSGRVLMLRLANNKLRDILSVLDLQVREIADDEEESEELAVVLGLTRLASYKSTAMEDVLKELTSLVAARH